MKRRPQTAQFRWLKEQFLENGAGFAAAFAYKKRFGVAVNTALVAAMRRALEAGTLARMHSSTDVKKWYNADRKKPASLAPVEKQALAIETVPPGLVKAMKDMARMMLTADIQRLAIDTTSGTPQFAVSVVKETQFSGALE